MRWVEGLGQNKLGNKSEVSTRQYYQELSHFPDGHDLEDDADDVDQKSNNDGFGVLWLDEAPEEAGNKYEIDEEISLVEVILKCVVEYHHGC